MKLLLALALVSVALAGCASGPATTSTTSSTTTPTTETSTPATSTPPTPTPAADVVIKMFAYAPAQLTRAVGQATVWRNDDATTHTVSADDGTFDGQLAPGATFTFTGTTDRTIPYHCAIHPGMKGNLTVGSGTPPPPTPTTTTTPPPPPSPRANATISAFQYAPNPLNVKVGTNVTWTNTEVATPHTVTADDNSWSSGTLAPTDAYSHTFVAAGTFAYHCKLHPFMTATVVVTA